MAPNDRYALLTAAEMARCDRATIAGGVPGETLMANAGAAVARAIQGRFSPRPAVVLCGPGNNGGDGHVVARLLAESGWKVTVAAMVAAERLKGDARHHATRWRGPTVALAPQALDGATLVVDALFGAGLTRELSGAARATIEAIGARGLVAVGVDVPSGVEGDTGAILGAAPSCALTVTFFRKKPGHLLLPGRALCGELVLADIGIPDSALDTVRPALWENHPASWRLPRPQAGGHKYSRGHAVIWGGARMTGAARLGARAALRVGAGLATICCPPEAAAIYQSDWASILVERVGSAAAFGRFLDDDRRNAVLVGPGAGIGPETRVLALAALERGKRIVLDADALTAFAGDVQTLFERTGPHCLLTPHDGEFRRLFGAEIAAMAGGKVARARAGAAKSGAVILLKGADTVIAGPDGRATINANAPPELATAGAGDVLAGLAVGLMAQGMDGFDAAAASSWLHGAAACAFGPGLVGDDLPDGVPAALRAAFAAQASAGTGRGETP